MNLQRRAVRAADCCRATAAQASPLCEYHTECERRGYTRSQGVANVTDRYLQHIVADPPTTAQWQP